MKPGNSLFFAIILLILAACTDTEKLIPQQRKPVDEMFAQRAYPAGEIPVASFDAAVKQAQTFREAAKNKTRTAWQFAGPENIGGRLTSLAIHPDNPETIYVGAASGGVFKSSNNGLNWTPVFDEAHILSVGDIAIAPSNAETVYVGTGEANAGGGSLAYDGYGVYKSIDGGDSWQHMGLTQSGSIGRIAVHPQDPDVVFVAAMGRLFANNSERGVFRTNDGGLNWQNVLYVNDSTGAVDVLIDPQQPNIVFAATWERVRRPDRRSYGGPGCGIYKSTDGGDTWIELQNGLPSGSNIGRIGLDICQASPNKLYAIYADQTGYFTGVFKTTNGGALWSQTNDASLGGIYSSYGWWFGRIVVDPVNANTAFALGLDVFKTTDGGTSWSMISSNVHVDQHDLVILPSNNNKLYLGNDAGLYTSQNAGTTWSHNNYLPITQFYTCDVDEQLPNRLYGGAQDLGTLRTTTGQFGDWYTIYGGDGFRVLVDPTNNNYIYAEYQYGGFARSTNGGAGFSSAVNGIDNMDRLNWHTPVVFNPLNPKSLYLGANRLYKTTQRAIYWQAISDDLSNGPGNGNLVYGTITCIDVNRADTNVIYCGTDNGHVWVTKTNGNQWMEITAGLPDRWVTSLSSAADDSATVYVSLSGYRYDSYIPHILKSTDYGQTWTDVSATLPEVPVNKVLVDPQHTDYLYAATDFGMYFSLNGGEQWQLMGDGLPNVPVCDLRLYNPDRQLIAATYGRSMYRIDLDELVGNPELTMQPKPDFIVWPNPVRDHLSVQCKSKETHGSICLYDAQGKRVTSWLISPELSESVIHWNPGPENKAGMYTISLEIKGKPKQSSRIILLR